uniref:Uncharacterized protein n=1 Tax=Anguilla anguilla TaxID=7936 RepID=A0A0E9UJN7_ANGAN
MCACALLTIFLVIHLSTLALYPYL